MNPSELIAIDTHTHLEVSCRNPFDSYGEEYDRAADKYFRSSRRPTMAETIAYYREKKIGFVNFTVDAETQMGRRRIPNEEIAEAAQQNSDIMIAFGSIDPHKGKMGAREARKLVEEYGVKGFKFHPTVQGFEPADRMAWPIYEVIAEHKLPAVFHSGHSGIGSGMRCGGGLRLQNSNPMMLEDVAIAFPDIQIVVAHPSWPWQDEALSLALHKPNIWIDLSGWSPRYFPPQLVQYCNTLLKDRILFGSDFPLITPDRTLVARRGPVGGDWIRISYAQMVDRARRVGQALLRRGLSVERPVAILSDNDLEHLTLALGAMWAGIPYTPVSAAYSLMSQDFGKLRHILGRITPGLVFASDASYARAIASVAGADVELVLTEGAVEGRATTPFAALLAGEPGAQVDEAHAKVGPDTIAKFLFTSGSTKHPKGVVNTHGMMCANQQMLQQTLAFLADEPPVLVDWLPWNHTFGGNHNVGITIYNGGTLYIDEGKPTPKGMAQTLANLREISPTIYFNVPKGFEEIATAMESDDALRESLFRRVKAFMFAGAGLSQAIWDQLDRLALRTVGLRIAMLTGLGMTETAPTCTFAVRAGEVRSGHIGLPCPGVEVKLVRDGDGPHAKTEVRFRGPNVMPGYWREPELSAAAFDEEGFYRTGDAVRWIDAQDPQRGLTFDGRIAEDFKLDSGTFVSVGPLRAKVIAEGSPCVQDAVVAGLNRSDVGLLLFPRLDECRRLAGLSADAPAGELLRHPAVHAFFQAMVDRLWRSGTGSANRVARAHLLVDPPSIDKGEVTDKGSINQRAVLAHRAAIVEALYDGGGIDVILPARG